MLTRREFLAGLGILTAAIVLPVKILESEESKKVQAPKLLDCDWLIDNVLIIDGSGEPGFRGRLAVKGEEIAGVGEFPFSSEVKVIDGQGLILAPGFIDLHTHTEDYVYSGGDMSAFLSQGVTTQIGGNCGRSPRDLEGYFKTVPRLPINYGLLMGYATLRQKVLGQDRAGKTTLAEITQMQKYLEQALKEGAVGFSVGLEYWPQSYATTEEVIALCEVVKEIGGFYATHIRSEYDQVLEAVEEAIEIGMKAEVPVQYSHLKAGYERNWSKVPRILEMLSEAEADGLDIRADFYGYTYSSTDLGRKPFRPSMSEENLELAARHPLTFFASDSGIYSGGWASHPRAYGNIPRILRRFVREKKILTWETAIAKLTSQPARRLNLKKRGLLKEGYQADLVLFDPETITDRATKERTTLFSEGVRQVWVNGNLAWSEGKTHNVNSGQKIS
ncbi:MAG TPA: D-aminoacylase [Clostridia bacterium]|jgi:N-acyl-D-amino-acid deacylase|nr:D-aminoacylase [Clostridia bacterium]